MLGRGDDYLWAAEQKYCYPKVAVDLRSNILVTVALAVASRLLPIARFVDDVAARLFPAGNWNGGYSDVCLWVDPDAFKPVGIFWFFPVFGTF